MPSMVTGSCSVSDGSVPSPFTSHWKDRVAGSSAFSTTASKQAENCWMALGAKRSVVYLSSAEQSV